MKGKGRNSPLQRKCFCMWLRLSGGHIGVGRRRGRYQHFYTAGGRKIEALSPPGLQAAPEEGSPIADRTILPNEVPLQPEIKRPLSSNPQIDF